MRPVCSLMMLAVVTLTASTSGADLKRVHEWKEMEYVFPSEEAREEAIANGRYISGVAVPIDVDIHYQATGRHRVFVTVPRFVPGIPVTLGIVTEQIADGGPMIEAYPNYSWQSSHGGDCDGITSVFRVQIDECNRMWVLDTGKIGDDQLCPPQILLFNLASDKLIMRHHIPSTQFKSSTSLLVTPIVDVRDPQGKCRDTFVYMADVTGYGLVVFDLRQSASWRVNNKLFYPHPTYGTFTIAGESFDLMDGVLGMSLSPPASRRPQGKYQQNGGAIGSRTLYFHALASRTENSVSTDILNNRTMWETYPEAEPRAFHEIGERNSQSAAEAMDHNGNLFFGLMDPIAVACWDSSTPYNPRNIHIVAQNDEKLQFSSGMKVIYNRKREQELWVLTCGFQKVMTGSINSQTVNFRIRAAKVNDLIPNGRCGSRKSPQKGTSSRELSPVVFPE